MFSIVRSNLAFIAHVLFLTIHALAIVLAFAYNSQTPDLYPNNAHHKIGWIITFVVLAQSLIYLTGWFAGVSKGRNVAFHAQALIPHPKAAHGRLLSCRHDGEQIYRLSHDSGQCAGSGTETSRNNLVSTTEDEDTPLNNEIYDQRAASPLPSITRPILAIKVASIIPFRGWKQLKICFDIIDRLILPFGFVAISTGVVTFGRLFVSGPTIDALGFL